MPGSAAQVATSLIAGYCSRRTGNLEAARTAFDKASDEDVHRLFPELVLRTKFQRAHVTHLSGRYDDATRIYEEIAASDASAVEEIEARETARRQLGDLLMLRGKFREALARFKESAAYASRDPLWAFECQRFIGHVHRFNWLLDAAERVYSPIVEECERRGIAGMLGKALVNVAETICWTQPSRAKEVASRAIELNEQIGNSIEIGKAMTALAIAHLKSGETGKAIDLSVRAEEIQREVGYKSGIVFAACARALAQRKLRRTKGMQEALQLVESTTKETGVYKHLLFIYGTACNFDHGLTIGDFDWLERTDIDGAIRTLIT
jgi:tetratricopeptide (TPR) repeat protein